MTAPLSLDLRQRLVASVAEGSSIRQAAGRYSVSVSAAIKLIVLDNALPETFERSSNVLTVFG